MQDSISFEPDLMNLLGLEEILQNDTIAMPVKSKVAQPELP